MKIFGRTVTDYVRVQIPFLILIVTVGLARLALSLLGIPDRSVRWLSLTALLPIGMLYAAIRVHMTGFGAYRRLLVVLFVQVLASQLIVAAGIAIAIITGQDNIFSRADAAGAVEETWGHAATHLFSAIPVSLVLWIPGSLVLLVARKS